MLPPSLQRHLLPIQAPHTAQTRHFHYVQEEPEISVAI